MLRKGIILTFFFLLLASQGNGQTSLIDSLTTGLITAKEDTQRVKMLNHLAFAYYRIQPDSTIRLATEGLNLARKLNYAWGEGVSLQRIGLGYNSLGQSEKAIDFYEQSLVTFRANGDSLGVSATLLNMGSSFYGQGRFDEAINVFEQALVIAEQAGNQRRMAGLLNNLGVVALGKSNYPVALDYYQRSLKLKEELGLKLSASSTIQNMGNIYLDLKDYEKAQSAYDRALQLKIEGNDKAGQAITLNNLGLLFIEKGDPQKGLERFQKAYQINEELGQDCAINYSINGLAECYWLLNKIDSALYYSTKVVPKVKECKDTELLANALTVLGAIHMKNGSLAKAEKSLLESVAAAQEIDKKIYIQRASQLLGELYKKQGKYQKALFHYEAYKAATDSIFNESNTREITQLEAQYEFDKERRRLEIENEKVQLLFDEELKRQALIRNGIIGGSVLLVLLAVNYYRSSQMKKRANEQLGAKNQQLLELSEFKDNLTHMIVHDMKNPLNAVIGLSKGEATQQKLHTIGQSGQQMLNMVSNMLDVQKFEEAKVTLNTESHPFFQLLKEAQVYLELLMHSKKVELKTDIDKRVFVDVDSELVVRVLGNLLSNAVKFSNLGGSIEVTAKLSKNEELLLVSITDHGPGLQAHELDQVFNKYWQGAKQAGHNSSTGLGLTFCKLAVEAHGGSISVDSSPNEFTTFAFSLPVAQVTDHAEEAAEASIPEREESLILESDIAVLSKYIGELGNLKVHQVGKINSIIRQMDQEEVKSPWKTNLVSAMHQGNQARFDELVDMLR